MSQEFDIYNNLNLISGCNFSTQLRESVAANCSNDRENVDDSFDDFDSLLYNNTVKMGAKVTQNQTTNKGAKEQEQNTNFKTSHSSSAKERPISPPLNLQGNVKEVLSDIPARRRSLRSLGRSNTTEETLHKATSSKRGRGGRGRGRGKGRTADTNASIITDESCNQSSASGDTQESILDTQESIPDTQESIINAHESIEPSVESTYSHLNQSCSGLLAVMRNRRRCLAEKAAFCPTLETINLVSSPFPFMESASENILSQFNQSSGGRLAVMRNRRRYIAEKAAFCPTLDTIDLVSSPFPRVEGTITLDSDGEEERPQTKSTELAKEFNLDSSVDDDNPELSVKIIWNCKPQAIKLRKYQKFATTFKLFAEREGVVVEKIVFNLNERIISPDDTPDSIGYKFFHFINGRVMATNESSPLDPVAVPKKQRNPYQIRLKIQSDSWKKPLQIDIMKTDKFRILYIKCAEELNIAIQQIKLSWDGEPLDPNETPANLDLEDGEAIDLHLKS